MKRTARMAIALCAVAGLMGASATAAVAAPSSSGQTRSAASAPLVVATGTMTVLCKVTNKAAVSRAILSDPAKTRALCASAGVSGSGAAAPAGRAVPEGVSTGACGESWFYIYQGSPSGHAEFEEGAYPYPAGISYGSASITVQNLSKGGTQNWADYVWANNSGWFWSNIDYRFTKTGIVFGYMSGDVLLDNGEVCGIDYPHRHNAHILTPARCCSAPLVPCGLR